MPASASSSALDSMTTDARGATGVDIMVGAKPMVDEAMDSILA